MFNKIPLKTSLCNFVEYAGCILTGLNNFVGPCSSLLFRAIQVQRKNTVHCMLLDFLILYLGKWLTTVNCQRYAYIRFENQ